MSTPRGRFLYAVVLASLVLAPLNNLAFAQAYTEEEAALMKRVWEAVDTDEVLAQIKRSIQGVVSTHLRMTPKPSSVGS